MKILFIILDGVADRPSPLLDDRTPLQAAFKPWLDSLATIGATGKVTVIDKKIPPETEGAVLAFLGFDPLKYNTGRGALEAAAFNYPHEEGTLIMRCNFATVNEAGRIIDTEAERIPTRESNVLIDFIRKNLRLEGVDFEIIPSLNYRFLLILKPKNQKLSSMITNNHPGYKRVAGNLEVPQKLGEAMVLEKVVPLKKHEKDKAALFTAKLINDFTRQCRELLKNHPVNKKRYKHGQHPANAVLMRGTAIEPSVLKSLPAKYGGKWVCIGDTPAEIGISRLAGIDIYADRHRLNPPASDCLLLTEKQLTEAMRKDLPARAKAVLGALKDYDFVYAHLKFADPFGHRNQPLLKKRSIELCDELFFKPILKNINLKNTVISVTSDHCTVCVEKTHTADSVPLVIAGGKIRPDGVIFFNEKACERGRLGELKALDFLECLFLHSA